MNDYEARQEARRERLEDAAARAQHEANTRYAQAKQMASAIPFGQPMMPDHYSYRRDRNYRDRIHNNYGKAFAANDRAAELRAKAAAVGTAGISSDDPEAADKIAARVAELEADQAAMKAANAAIRKHAKAGHVALARCLHLPPAARSAAGGGMTCLGEKFRPADHLHWLTIICWTCGVIALAGLSIMVRS